MLPEHVGHGHTERRADAREGKNQQANQRPVARADHSLRVDAVELPRFGRGQYRGLAGADHVSFGLRKEERTEMPAPPRPLS